MKKIFYFIMLAAAINFVACTDKNTEVLEETAEKGQVIEIGAEDFLLFNDKDTQPQETAGTRIIYIERDQTDPHYPGLDARWQFKPSGTGKIQDKVEVYLKNTNSTRNDKVVGRVSQLLPYDPNKLNVCKLITVVTNTNLNQQLFYCSVTGSGMADNRAADQILNYQPDWWGNWDYIGITNAQYFDASNYPKIKTAHVTTDRIMNLTDNYESHLKKSIIQVVSGTVSSGYYIFMRYRPIVMLINLNLKNTSGSSIKITKIELKSTGNTQWVYDMNSNTSRYDPETKAMTGNSPKLSTYTIYQNNTGTNVANNSTLTSYQVAIPAVASVSDLKMDITIGGSVKTIDLSGAKALAPEKRIKITRTWNGTAFVKE